VREEGGVIMQTKSELSRLFILLHLVGIAVLVLAFFLLIPAGGRTHSAWLDLVVVCIVLSINFPPFAIVRLSLGNFNVKIPALGLLEICDAVYSTLALGLVIYGLFNFLPFRIQLVGQMGLLFAVATTISTAWWASAHAADVVEEEHLTRSGLEDLKAALSHCESEFCTKAPNRNRERQLLLKLKEDTRYLSPSRDPSAVSYERQIVALVDNIRLRLDEIATPLTPSPLDEQFEQCAALMALRKQNFVQ
jgi:hypothetical protein